MCAIYRQLLTLQKRICGLSTAVCQRQMCRVMWRNQLCVQQPAAPTTDHGSKASASTVPAAATESPPRKRARKMDETLHQQLLEFLELHPRLKQSLGGLMVRFYGSRVLPGRPIDALMAILQEKIFEDLFFIERVRGASHYIDQRPKVRRSIVIRETNIRITHHAIAHADITIMAWYVATAFPLNNIHPIVLELHVCVHSTLLQIYYPPAVPNRRFPRVCLITGKPMKQPTRNGTYYASEKCGTCLTGNTTRRLPCSPSLLQRPHPSVARLNV